MRYVRARFGVIGWKWGRGLKQGMQGVPSKSSPLVPSLGEAWEGLGTWGEEMEWHQVEVGHSLVGLVRCLPRCRNKWDSLSPKQ